MRNKATAAILAVTIASFATPMVAADYLTSGVDNARTGWIRDESVLTKANVGGVKLLWSRKLDGATPREMHNLFSPLVAERVNTPSGVKEVAVVAGVENILWGLDAKTGGVLWTKKMDTPYLTGVGPTSGTLCPGGQTANPAMEKMADGRYRIWALAGDGRLWQIDAATGENIAAPERASPPGGKVYALTKEGDNIYAMFGQGCGGITYQMIAYNTVTRRTTALYPGGGGLWARRGVTVDANGRAYAGTGDGPYYPEDKQYGTAIIAAKVDNGGMFQMDGWFAPRNVGYLYRRDLDQNTSPVALDYRGRKLLLTNQKECRLTLLDRDNLGGADHQTALATSGLQCNDRGSYDANGVWGSMAAYVNSRDEAWVYIPFWGPKSKEFNPPLTYSPAPVMGGVAAYTITPRDGGFELTPKWLSQNINIADEALVANDVVWTFGSGEGPYQRQPDRAWDSTAPPPRGGSAGRIAQSTHATIFALDAKTGKTLWSSGDQITSFNHFSSITVANGRVYLGTYDGTLWCFGLEQ